MSWLDDRQAADPAYPDPDTDPWASPGYAPDTSRGLPVEIAYTMGEQARQRNAGAEHPGLFQLHARLDSGHLEAARDVIADWTSGPDHISPGRDWHQLREAEAWAREEGLRASVPQPDGQDTPEYQADAAAWGTGRGIEPDEPEAAA